MTNPQQFILVSPSGLRPEIVSSLHQTLLIAEGDRFQFTKRMDEASKSVESSLAKSLDVVLLANCLTKEDIAEYFQKLSGLSDRILEGRVRVVVLNSIAHPRLASLLRSRIEVDVVDFPIALAALLQRIRRGHAPLSTESSKPGAAPAGKTTASSVLDHPFVKPARGILEAAAGLGAKLGLAPVDVPGISVGEKSFESLDLRAEASRKNGKLLSALERLSVLELGENTASFFAPREFGKPGDLFAIHVTLGGPGTPIDCAIEWEYGTQDLELEDGSMVSGIIRTADFPLLFRLKDRIEARKGELRDFLNQGKK